MTGVLVAVVALLPACDESSPDAPTLERVQPGEGLNTVATPVVISGDGFNPLVRVNYNDKQRSLVSTAFFAHLGTHTLEQVTYQDAKQIRALVPAGLVPGSYDLTLVDPRGGRVVLEHAFVVKDGSLDAGPDVSDADLGLDLPPMDLADGPPLDLPRDGAPDVPPDTIKPDTAGGPMVSTLAGTGQPGFKDGVAATAQLYNPRGLAVSGNDLFVGDFTNHRIRRINAGQVTTLAGDGNQGLVNGAAAAARFNYPVGVAVDGSGSVYVADSSNDVIRMIESGVVSTLAGSNVKGFLDGAAATARFNYPRGVAVYGSTVYVADSENHRIRTVQGGMVSTLAGSTKGFADGPAATARFDTPTAVLVSGATVYVADTGNHRIRMVQGGVVSTVAGVGTVGNTDGAALTVARFWNPVDLALSGTTIYVADQGNHRIREIKQGVVSTLSGSSIGFKDGLVGTALFYYPSGLAMSAGGAELYVADQSNHRIRVITF